MEKRSTILIAEDDNDSRLMLRMFLESRGYKVVEALDGREAVELACSIEPDLILMDLNMPGTDGISAAKQIRQYSKLSKIPIIANSAYGQFGIKLFSNIDDFGEGLISYITKPLSLAELDEQVEYALRYKSGADD